MRIVLVVLAAAVLASVSEAAGQGVSSGAIHAIVRAADGSDVEGADVAIVNTATGFVLRTHVRRGRFFVSGLEVGGPYTVRVERPGFRAEQYAGLALTLGEPLELSFVLQPAAIPLDPLHVAADAYSPANVHGGIGIIVSDSLLHRLPTLNRNLYDFVRLAPQVSTRIGFAPGGMSAGGVGFRFNSFLINGVSQRSVPGNQPPEFAGGRSIPFDAVREYQILVAPFDARYGDFAGALVNAVTRSGTNELRGSAFVYGRNDALARTGEVPYERLQYGFTLSGPIWRDRVHFFVAPELQHLTSLAPGPYLGDAAAGLPMAEADLARLHDIMGAHGLTAGSAGAVQNRQPLESVFARLDIGVPEWNSRGVLWVNETRARNLAFSRATPDVFPLSTHAATQASATRTASLQVHSALRRAGGGHNELLASYRLADAQSRSAARQPVVRVAVPSTSGGSITVVTGTPPQAHGGTAGYRSLSLRNDLTLPLGASHVATAGVEAEWFRAERGGVLNAYGTWTFANLDSLARGVAESFVAARDLGGAGVPITGVHYAAYVGDQWRARENLTITLGVRMDVPAVAGSAPYNAAVDSIFGRRTDIMARRRVHLSPRAGFTWDPTGAGRDRVRGGVGVFTGRPPVAWLHSPLQNYGGGIGVLRCGRSPADLGPAPPFVPDHRAPPAECANGVGVTPPGDVDLLDRELRMAQTVRGVLALDRRLTRNLTGTVEALLSRSVSDFVFVDLNLAGPQGVDRFGRVLYGTVGSSGLPSPALRSGFASVTDLRNTSRNHAYQLSARLERRYADGAAVMAHYTFSRVRDVQTPLRVNVPGSVNWGSRALAGRHEVLSPGVSLNDIPHRVVVAATQRAPWRRWTTAISLQYVGESGSPFTYVAAGAGRRGDLNADGIKNDPIYVPRSAFDVTEIRFSGQSDARGTDNSPTAQAERVQRQQEAFEQLIQRTRCLQAQRGRIMERNSCREPWAHSTTASLRQEIPVGGRALSVQLDVHNVLNLLSREWGHQRLADPALLEHVDQTPGSLPETQPVFRFDATAAQWFTLPAESTFQLQIAVRYRF